MAELDNIIDNLRALQESIFVAHPALVDKVYPKKMRADVVLKTKKEVNGETIDPPKINKLPISHHKSKTFYDSKLPEKNDPCWVVFFDREIDNLIKNLKKEKPKVDRVHDESDAFIVGEWKADEEEMVKELGSMKPEDWIMGVQRDTNSRIYMKNNGDIVIHPGSSENRVELVEDAEFHVALFEMIKELYNGHKHPYPEGLTQAPRTDDRWGKSERSDRVKVDN